MIDSIFIIGSALAPLPEYSLTQSLYSCVGSKYSYEERFQQTVETINSINKYCPNNKKYIFDCSPIIPNKEYITYFENNNVEFFYVGQDSEVKKNSTLGYKNIAETLGFILFLNKIKNIKPESQRIYKISGRYKINDNFILDNNKFKDHFVFAKSQKSHLSNEMQQMIGISKYYSTRLFHMDSNYFNMFYEKLKLILEDCKNYRFLDVEHAYFKYLNMLNVIEVEKIGVSGNVSPSGIYIEE